MRAQQADFCFASGIADSDKGKTALPADNLQLARQSKFLQWLNNEDLKKLEMVLKIRDVAQSNDLGGIITGIDITDDENYKIIFENENKIAYIGDCSNLSTRILYVKSILQQEQLKSGEIFVNMDLNKQYPFFREKV